jgi:hypothetical protein
MPRKRQPPTNIVNVRQIFELPIPNDKGEGVELMQKDTTVDENTQRIRAICELMLHKQYPKTHPPSIKDLNKVFSKPSDVIREIEFKWDNAHTRANYYSSINAMYTRGKDYLKSITEDMIQKYKSAMETATSLVEENKSKMIPTKNMLKYPDVEWTDIILKRNDWFQKKQYKTYSVYKSYLLVSLYTDIPPRRTMEYYTMKVYESKAPNNVDDDENYMVFSRNKPISVHYGDFKTRTRLGKEIMEVKEVVLPEKLSSTIKEYIKKKKEFKSGDNLFVNETSKQPYAKDAFTKLLNKAFNEVTGYAIGCNDLRHYYITELGHNFIKYYPILPQIAEFMGDSKIQTMTDYAKDLGARKDRERVKIPLPPFIDFDDSDNKKETPATPQNDSPSGSGATADDEYHEGAKKQEETPFLQQNLVVRYIQVYDTVDSRP